MDAEVKSALEFAKEYSKRTVGWLLLIFLVFIIAFINCASMIGKQKAELDSLRAKLDRVELQSIKRDEMVSVIIPVISNICVVTETQTKAIKELKNMAEIQLLSRGTPDYDAPAKEEEQSSSGKTIILDNLDKKTLEKLKTYYIDNKSQLLNDNIAPNSNANCSDSVQSPSNQPK